MQAYLLVIIVTCIISFIAIQKEELKYKMMLYPVVMKNNPAEWYRFISSGFVHVDYMHLLFNMISLYFFGKLLEIMKGPYIFLILYLTAIIVADIPSFRKQKEKSNYASLGASGGVAAIIFAVIYQIPWEMMNVFFIPMPCIIFAVVYLGYSFYMSRQSGGYINHDAHFWGAVYGLLFAWAIDPTHGAHFIEQLQHPRFFN